MLYARRGSAERKENMFAVLALFTGLTSPGGTRPGVEEIQKAHAEMSGSKDYPSIAYSEIVQCLYDLLCYPLMPGSILNAIMWQLEEMTNHEFHSFIHLVNPRHSPHKMVRYWAMEILKRIAGRGSYSAKVLPGTINWRRGARQVVARFERRETCD